MSEEIDFRKAIDFVSKEKSIIIGLFLFSFIIHILLKNGGLYHFDSAYDTITVERAITNKTMVYSYGWGAPGMVVLVGAFYAVHKIFLGANSAEFSYFLVNFLTSSLAVVVLYLFAKKITKDKFISFVSALLFSVTPIWLSVTTYPKTHAISVFVALLAGLLMLIGIEKNSNKYFIGASALIGYAISIRPFDAFFLLPFGLLYLYNAVDFSEKKLKLHKQYFTWQRILSIAAPIVIVWYVLFLPKFIQVGGMSKFFDLLAYEQRQGWQGLFSPQAKISLSYVTRSIGWLGWLAAALGLFYLYLKKQKYLILVLLSWFAVFFFYLGNLLPTEARFILPAIIPLIILIAMGCKLVHANNKYAGIALAAVIFILTFSSVYPTLKDRHDYSGTREFAEWIKEVTEPNALIASSDEYLFVNRYGNRSTFYFGGEKDEKILFIKEKLEKGNPVYAMETSFYFMTPYERDEIPKQFNFALVGEKQNEVYQFSELDRRIYSEKLFRITLKQ